MLVEKGSTPDHNHASNLDQSFLQSDYPSESMASYQDNERQSLLHKRDRLSILLDHRSSKSRNSARSRKSYKTPGDDGSSISNYSESKGLNSSRLSTRTNIINSMQR